MDWAIQRISQPTEKTEKMKKESKVIITDTLNKIKIMNRQSNSLMKMMNMAAETTKPMRSSRVTDHINSIRKTKTTTLNRTQN